MDWKQKIIDKNIILENNKKPINHELSKAKNEEINLKRFLDLLNQDDIKYESFLKEPEPDFLLLSQDKNISIGLELTSLNLDHLKGSEKQIKFIIDNACNKFETENPELKYHLSISFSWDNVINKDVKYLMDNKKRIMTDLIQIIESIESLKSNRKSFTMNKVFDFHNSLFINRITVRNVANSRNLWHKSGGTVVQKVQNVLSKDEKFEDLILTLINNKSGKPLKYEVDYDELWLLIYAIENSASTLFTLDDFDYNKIYQSRYDKVYLMLENKLVLLKTEKL